MVLALPSCESCRGRAQLPNADAGSRALEREGTTCWWNHNATLETPDFKEHKQGGTRNAGDRPAFAPTAAAQQPDPEMATQDEKIKWVEGSPFMVDGFRFTNPRCRHYLLTHFHSGDPRCAVTAV